MNLLRRAAAPLLAGDERRRAEVLCELGVAAAELGELAHSAADLRGSGGGEPPPRSRIAGSVCVRGSSSPSLRGTDGPRRGPRRARRARAARRFELFERARRRPGSRPDVAAGRLRARGHAGSVRRVAGGVRAGARALPALGLVGRRLPVRARGGALLRSDPRLAGQSNVATRLLAETSDRRASAQLLVYLAGLQALAARFDEALETLARGETILRELGETYALANNSGRLRGASTCSPATSSPGRAGLPAVLRDLRACTRRGGPLERRLGACDHALRAGRGTGSGEVVDRARRGARADGRHRGAIRLARHRGRQSSRGHRRFRVRGTSSLWRPSRSSSRPTPSLTTVACCSSSRTSFVTAERQAEAAERLEEAMALFASKEDAASSLRARAAPGRARRSPDRARKVPEAGAFREVGAPTADRLNGRRPHRSWPARVRLRRWRGGSETAWSWSHLLSWAPRSNQAQTTGSSPGHGAPTARRPSAVSRA